MTFTGVRPQWTFQICSVNYQRDPATHPIRKLVGIVEPVGEVTIVHELNRPGSARVPINIQGLSPDVYQSLVDIGAPPLELVVLAPTSTYIIFAGPIVGFTTQGRDKVTLEAKGMLHYLDMMKLHFPYKPDSPVTVGELCKFLIDQAQNLAPYETSGTDIQDKMPVFTNHGIRANAAGLTQTIQPGTDNEPHLDPRDGRTILEIIEDFSERGPTYGFDYSIEYWSSSDPEFDLPGWTFLIGGNGHQRNIGEDLTDSFTLRDEHLTNHVNTTSSLLPENFCSGVYAMGAGSEASSVGVLRGDIYEPADEDGRPWFYAIADEEVLEQMGLRIYQISSDTTIESEEDGGDSPEATRPQSLQNVAEAYLHPRQEKFLVPDRMELEVDTNSATWSNPRGRGLLAAYGTIDVGDTITIDLTTGLGRGVAPRARIKKKTVTVGSRTVMNLEFV